MELSRPSSRAPRPPSVRPGRGWGARGTLVQPCPGRGAAARPQPQPPGRREPRTPARRPPRAAGCLRAAFVIPPAEEGQPAGRRLIAPCLRAVSRRPASRLVGLSPLLPAPRWRAAPRGLPGGDAEVGAARRAGPPGPGRVCARAGGRRGCLRWRPEGPRHPPWQPLWEELANLEPGGPFWETAPSPFYRRDTGAPGSTRLAKATPAPTPPKIVLILGLEKLSFPSAWVPGAEGQGQRGPRMCQLPARPVGAQALTQQKWWGSFSSGDGGRRPSPLSSQGLSVLPHGPPLPCLLPLFRMSSA